ncbi:hypothetical protein P7C71_g5742, partial [Lecanoromycetidae sp. Uapishka_2]
MTLSHRYGHEISTLSSPSGSDREKQVIEDRVAPETNISYDEPNDQSTRLHRGLKARHITMIVLGGALGSGLLIGTGSALAEAGPGSILICYTIIGFVAWIVLCSLGEIATWLPTESGFTGYAARFCDPALGFSLGYTYCFKYLVITPNQLTACSLVIQYWVDRDRVNPGVFIAIFLIIIITINYLGIRFFGEIEFWLSSAKARTFSTGKDIIDREEEAFLVHKAEKEMHDSSRWFYRRFVAWLF